MIHVIGKKTPLLFNGNLGRKANDWKINMSFLSVYPLVVGIRIDHKHILLDIVLQNYKFKIHLK